jgi:pimeloyl-ACP methyl ester carboxylesterase
VTEAPTVDAAPRFIQRDGVRLAYEERGHGDRSVILIHGMACDHTHFAAQMAHLSKRCRVVAVDLRGHGHSDKPAAPYNNEVFGDDLRFLMEKLELGPSVFIGHSLGGSIALDLVGRHRELFEALILFDSGIRPPGPKSAELSPFYASLGGPDHALRVGEFVRRRLVEPTDGAELIKRIAATMGATPSHVFLAMADGVLAFDSHAAALANTQVPSLLILGARPFAEPASVAALGPNWQIGQVVGSGHFIQMVVPEQVNAMLDRFLDLLAAH